MPVSIKLGKGSENEGICSKLPSKHFAVNFAVPGKNRESEKGVTVAILTWGRFFDQSERVHPGVSLMTMFHD